jgi:SAM-dependent methyltransferase
MQSGLTLLSELSDADVDWMLLAGKRQRMSSNGVVVTEGTQVNSMYLVLQGLLSVYLPSLGGKELATLGAGQTFGEMSFLEDRPASATVKTLEDTELLVIPRPELAAKLDADPAFAARLYKALAKVTSRRLREMVGTLGRWLEDQPPAEPKTLRRWQEIADKTQQFKKLILSINKAPADAADVLCEELETAWQRFGEFMNKAIGDGSSETVDAREELGARIQREILPFLLKSKTIERIYTKPRGYPGDFLTTALFYERRPAGDGPGGNLFDRCFLDLPPVDAIRSRRDLLAEEIARRAAKTRRPLSVTAICSGAGDELFAAQEKLSGRAPFAATLIDFDAQALAAVAERSESRHLTAHFTLLNTNLFDLTTGRPPEGVANQDLVYSLGLPDYFDDKLLTKLLNYMFRLLKPGGTAIIASFHGSDPFKAFLDHVVDWKLTHRTEGDVEKLFLGSTFQQPSSAVQFEPGKIIFLAECQKTK